MAIFFNHIKGCGASSTGQENSTKDLWTWIKFADIAEEAVNTSLTDGNKSVDYLPSILLYSSNSANATKYDFGKIITSNAINQKIYTSFGFENNVNIKQGYKLYWWDSSYIEDTNDVLVLHGENVAIESENDIYLQAPSYINDIVTIDKSATYGVDIEESTKIKYCLYVGSDKDTEFDPTEASEGTIKAKHKCEALFFNATSDRRAKSNITPVHFSALSTINSLPIYSFNYTSQPETITIGLIAQEAAEHNLDGFNLVDNLDATGKGGNMMQMKESKLVYVLWKAVQELSAEVEELKAEIRNLK